MSAPAAYDDLRNRLTAICDLGGIGQLLFWDQQTKMPVAAAGARAEQTATIGRLSHQLFVSDEIGRLIEELRAYEESLPYDSDEASLIRIGRHDWEKARQVPPDLTAEMRRSSSLALRAWAEARPKSDYEALKPHLERNLGLRRRYIDCFEPADEPYDILLDDYERGMKTAEVRAVFDRLKEGLIELLQAVEPADTSQLDRPFPQEGQERFAMHVLDRFGFDPMSWRLDPTSHPFMSSPGHKDIRITTNYSDSGLRSLFATMHEFGHGIYEYGIDAALARTPLGTGASMGLHESQSRMWENLVGRSGPFWSHFYPELQQTFPGALDDVDEESFFRAVNAVKPSLIRVDADEITYSLHIILRFELEQELLAGTLPLDDLPEAWNARMKEYIGIDVPNDADGVLQDMHWASGHLGYFPTYALGNVISVQIWNAALEAIPDIPQQVAQGEFAPLREWLTENLYRHGRKFTPVEMLERITGSRIDPEPYLAYLRDKHLAAATA
ncbi:MAG: carboxypeptidase M32 [Thermoleophilia bacterium]